MEVRKLRGVMGIPVGERKAGSGEEKLVTIGDCSNHILTIVRASFLIVGEESCKCGKEKTKRKLNPRVLDWNWRYQCKLMVVNM